MRRKTALVLLGLVLVGCAGKNDTGNSSGGSDNPPTVDSPHQATVEVEGMV